MLGADILAQTLCRWNVGLVTHVPGHGATQAAAAHARTGGDGAAWLHEEVAFGAAHGAALTGTRAILLTKTHGLHKAANALADALACGVTAGLVVLTFDDPTGSHSDSVLEAEPLLHALRVPHRRSRAATLAQDLAWAITTSEALALPTALVLDAPEMTQEAPAPAPAATPPAPPTYARDPWRHLACPMLAGHQRALLEAKLAGQDWRALPRPPLPHLDALPDAFLPTLRAYRPVFNALQDIDPTIVAGDAGLSSAYGLPPYDAVDLVAQMGGSTPLALGATLTGRDAWALTGDFSFVAAGHLGLLEAKNRRAPLKTLILANGKASATGNQPVPEQALETVLAGYDKHTQWVTTRDAPQALQEAAAADTMRTVVVMTG